MKLRSRKYIIYFSLMVLITVASASAIAYFNEERIRAIAIKQLNSLLDTEVNVEHIEFSLLKRFPKASIHFKSVVVKEKSDKESPENLLEASSLFLEFNPLDLLTHNYTIDVVYLEKATLNVKVFQNGSNNFQFIKPQEENADFKISLKEVALNKSTLVYSDDYNSLYFKSDVTSLQFAGEFESDEFDLSVRANGTMERFKLNAFKSKKVRDFDLNIDFAVNKASNLYSFKNAQVNLGLLSFNCQGTYQKINEGINLNVGFGTMPFSFHDALYLMPENIQQLLSEYDVSGDLRIDGDVKGRLDKNTAPSIDIAFSLHKGELLHKESNVKIKDVHFKGIINNGEGNDLESSIFQLKEVAFSGKHGESKGSLSITNFKNPYLNFEFNSILDLSNIHKIVANDSLESISGVIEYNIKAETNLDSLSDFTLDDLKSMKSEGDLTLTNGSFKLKKYEHVVSEINAKARFGNNVIHIDTLGYKIGDIKSSIKGKFSNFLPFLFYEKEKMRAQAEIYYPNLDVNKFLSEDGSASSGFFLPVSPVVELDLKLTADKLAFRKFEAENVTCHVLSKHPYFIVQNLKLNAMEGDFLGWIQLNVSDHQNLELSSELTLTHVNIKSLFYQFENFGQREILSENIRGIAYASIDLKGTLNKDFQINQESIEANSHIEVLDGRLINYETILALSKYVDVEELKDIRFSRLTNDVQIKNRTVVIPEMEIKSSALELWLSGKQTFDGDLDYHFTLWLNDFLFKKAKRSKKKKDEFGEVELDKEGRAKLFLRMYGNINDYKIKLDKKALREKWNNDLKTEKQALKDLFKLEFGKDKKKENEAPMQFEMEWEELENEPREATQPDQSMKDIIENKKKEKTKTTDNKLGGKKIEDEYEEYDPSKFD